MAYEPKTKPTDASVDEHIAQIADPRRRQDCEIVRELLEQLTGEAPRMWGTAIVGFGSWFIPQGGKKPPAEWPRLGFSSRKQDLTVYLTRDFVEADADLLARLGKHRTGVCCLYLKRLADIDVAVLRQLLERSNQRMDARYPEAC